MKKLIVVVLVSMVVFTSCSEDSVLSDLGNTEEMGGVGEDPPIIED